MVELETDQIWMLQRAGAPQPGGELARDLVPGGQGYPGSAGHSGTEDAASTQVIILRGGAQLRTIGDVTYPR